MEPRHLLHSALTHPPSVNVRRLKSGHPFVPAAQQLISLSDNNSIRAALWVDHDGMRRRSGCTTLRGFVLLSTTTLLEWLSQEQRGPAEPPPHRCRTFPILLVQMGYGPLCGLWVWRRRTNRPPCCPPMSNPSASSWTTWPDGSGRRTTQWMLNNCPEIQCSLAADCQNSLKRRRWNAFNADRTKNF